MTTRPEVTGRHLGTVIDDPSLTIPQFCAAENISTTTFYKLEIRPRTMTLPGTSAIRITDASRREWHERVAKVNEEKATALERQRAVRAKRASAAGKAGAASSDHWCRLTPEQRDAHRARNKRGA